MTTRYERQEPVSGEFDDDIHEVPSHTPDFRTELAGELSRLVPEAVADGKIDIEKLRELLSEDVADDGREGFGLVWPGKARALKAAQAPTTATLVPDREASKDWDTTGNVFIEGDNLEVLKILQKHYHGKIKMIYIDPPYNTGNDFIYPDNFKEGLQTYLEWTKQVSEDGKKLSSNPESAGRYHSNWLNMMYPRLKLARDLLTPDGAIFISIDDHEVSNLMKLCDEVFGEQNHLNTFVWINNLKGRQISSFGAALTKEYVLTYAREASKASSFVGKIDWLKSKMPTAYRGLSYSLEEDEFGPFVLKNELHNTNSVFNEETRPNLVFDIYYEPETGKVETADVSADHVFPGFVKIFPKRNNNGINRFHAFRWSRTKVENESQNLAFRESKDGWKVYTKVRTVETTAFKDVITDITTSSGSKDIELLGLESSWFDYPKPVDLVTAFLAAATESDSAVMDFFSGSGTTAQAVMALNARDGGSRKHIQVQLPEPVSLDSNAGKAGYGSISQIARHRIRVAGEKIKEDFSEQLASRETPLDVGFRSYKLSDTSFVKWRETSAVEQNALEQRLAGLRGSADDDATPEMLLTELLLKQGYSLTESVAEVEIAGLKVWSVADGALLAVMDEHVKPSLEQLRAVVEAGAVRLVILEDVLAGDDQLKTNLVQHAKTHGVELWSA
jgi:adenine-specific DNA-methyltransferase